MISFEVARELRDAGYPQDDHLFYWWEETTPPMWWNIYALKKQQPDWKKTCAAPTLEVLIHACGGNSVIMLMVGLTTTTAIHWVTAIASEGKTPADAVARLWVALNPVDSR